MGLSGLRLYLLTSNRCLRGFLARGNLTFRAKELRVITVKEGLSLIEQILDKRLSKLQELIVRQAWRGCSYKQIAKTTNRDVGHIKNLGSELWQALSHALDERVTKQNFQSVLQQQWSMRHHFAADGSASSLALSKAETQLRPFSTDWDEAIDVSVFVDRAPELELLTRWVVHDHCRLLLLLGMGGIGKTALAVTLAQQFADKSPAGSSLAAHPFQVVIWRSLREAPPIAHLLADLLKLLSDQDIALPDSIPDRITQLIQALSASRCLLVLDNMEPLLQGGEQVGQFRPDCGDYAELFRRLAQPAHQSCVVITSREAPQEISQLAGRTRPVRILQLSGLGMVGGQAIFAEHGTFHGTESEWRLVVEHYAGNPLALKIAASRIQDVLDGDLSRFIRDYLQAGQVAFADIDDLLDRQFERLSHAEQDIMYWLAVNREPVTDSNLREDIFAAESRQKLIDALAFLKQRSLIEKTINGFTQQPVVMEYVTERLIERIVREIVEWTGETAAALAVTASSASAELGDLLSPLPTLLLCRYALMKAQCKDYVREAQTRLIVQPIVDQLLLQFGSKANLESRLQQILSELRQHAPLQPGYAAGNILNLLCYLQFDLNGYDFSDLAVWQAYLPAATLSSVNFARSDLSKSVFAESFGGIVSVAFSPDGQQLVIADSNGGIRLWEVDSGRSLMTLRAHESWIWAIAFSPDGRWLASASDDNTAKLWDVATGTCLRTLKGHTQAVLSVAFSPDGNWLATSSDDLTIRLWNISGLGEHDQSWIAHDRRVWSLAFSPDGRMLASSSEDQTVKLWDPQTATCLQTLAGHANWVKGVAFHPNSALLATGSHDHTIKLWDVSSGQCLRTLIGHHDAATAVSFSADGQQLVSSSHDHTLRLWDVNSGRCTQVMQGHTNRLWSVAFHPDGRRVVSGGDDHAAKLWDGRSGQCLKTFRGYTNALLWMTLNGDRTVLASGHEDETIKLWNMQTKRVFRTLRGHADRVWAMAFSPQSSQTSILASGSGDQTIKLWNWRTGECLKTLQGHSSWVWAVVFHPTTSLLASGSYDGTVKLWEIPSGICLRTLNGHTAPVVDAIFDASGDRLLSCGFDETIRIWHAKSGDCLQILTGHSNKVWRLALSPDQRQLASCSYDNTLKLWDVSTGDCLQTFVGHRAPVVALAFDADGQRLFSGSFDQTIKLWDLQTGQCLRTLTGHRGIISTLLPDGDRLLSSSLDETIKCWNVETGECLETLRTPRPYDGMNILGAQGLTDAQKMTLEALGAIEAVVPPSLVSVTEYRQNNQRNGNPLKYSVK
jgi:WD40 repeat protein